MKDFDSLLNPNPLVTYLDKCPADFTKADIIKYIENNGIEMVNFRYVGEDSRLKELNFSINNKKHLDSFLSSGERVDGSSLFSNIEAGSSDLYVMPRFKTAFLNPFTEIPTIDILCSYFNKEGNHLASSPEYILRKAQQTLISQTGFSFEAMGELEYYIMSENQGLYQIANQKGYHESAPFTKWDKLRKEAMRAITQAGGLIKYGHSEVGYFNIDNTYYEQNEIEFLPTNVEDAADQLIIAKWIIRMIGYKYGLPVSFAPKITVGKAGSGLHIHTRLIKNGKNAMVENGQLSNNAKRAIAGYLSLAPSLTAFGNTIPTSYLRLVPNQEAPTNICWGDRNRSVLVRVPLGWTGNTNMLKDANPLELPDNTDYSDKQTVEFRCPDGSADIYLLLAGLTVAARHGLEMENALEFAQKSYVDVNVFKDEFKEITKNLAQLPSSCSESADYLKKQSDIYKKYDVFSQATIDGIINKLKNYDDKNLRKTIKDNPSEIERLVEEYLHFA
ncbi:MAG: glutamine synthetase [Bacteroidetes bacterium]|nr:glutamine synthetase [Bacteroidota bacterium]